MRSDFFCGFNYAVRLLFCIVGRGFVFICLFFCCRFFADISLSFPFIPFAFFAFVSSFARFLDGLALVGGLFLFLRLLVGPTFA